jgi:predicted RND superfamily exporter protein
LTSVFRFCVRRPRVAIALAALATLAAAPGLLRLRLRTDGRALVPAEEPAVRYDARVREAFGVEDPLVVTITSSEPSGIFNPRTLALVRDLSADLARVPGIEAEDVLSLATEKRDRVRPGTLDFLTFLEPFPSTAERLQELREDVRALRILNGTLVSYDERTAAIVAGVRPDRDRARIHDEVRSVIGRRDPAGHVVRVAGAPVAEALLGRHLLEDLSLLVPLVVLVVSILIYALTRSGLAVLLAVCEAAATILFTFGVMGYAGVPVYLTMIVLPVSLAAVAVADDIHVFSRYQQTLERAEGTPDAAAATIAAMQDVRRPILLTSLTTALGFLSFTTAPIAPIQAFGAFECVGVLFAMAWTFTVTPAVLSRIDPARLRRPSRAATPGLRGLDPRLLQLGAFLVRHRLAALGAIAIVLALAPLGVRRIVVQDGWIDGFSRTSEFRQDTSFVESAFHGTHVLLVTVDAGSQRDRLLEPAVLERVGGLEAHVRTLPAVGGVLGPYSHLEVMNFSLSGRKETFLRRPDTVEEATKAVDYMDRFRSLSRRREVIDDERRSGLVTAFLRNANFRDAQRVMDGVREHARLELEPHGIQVDFAGDVAVSQAMIPAIVRSQLSSLALTLVSVLVLSILLFRSVAQGIACVIPAAAAAVGVLALMGLAGVPLGVATSMFCAITIGIGVDYGIHLAERCRALAAVGLPLERAIPEALATSGWSITIDAVAIAFGFGVLLASRVPANGRLGALIGLSIALCWSLTMIGLPSLLAAWKPAFVRAAQKPPRPEPAHLREPSSP